MTMGISDSFSIWKNIWFFFFSVHGVEYAFGAHEYSSTGIFEGEPKRCEGFRFRKTILIGKTDVGPSEVKGVMEELAAEYRGNAYNLITKNCNHFCNDACVRLTGNPIPSWVNRLARIGNTHSLTHSLTTKQNINCFLMFVFLFFVLFCFFDCSISAFWYINWMQCFFVSPFTKTKLAYKQFI